MPGEWRGSSTLHEAVVQLAIPICCLETDSGLVCAHFLLPLPAHSDDKAELELCPMSLSPCHYMAYKEKCNFPDYNFFSAGIGVPV